VVTRPAISLAQDRESSPARTGGLTTCASPPTKTELWWLTRIFKMAAAAISDIVNRFMRPPATGTDGLKCPFKFRVGLIYSTGDIAISIFLTFGLKLPNHAHFLDIFGYFDTLNSDYCHRNPQKAHPWVNPRRLMYRSCKSVHPFLL